MIVSFGIFPEYDGGKCTGRFVEAFGDPNNEDGIVDELKFVRNMTSEELSSYPNRNPNGGVAK